MEWATRWRERALALACGFALSFTLPAEESFNGLCRIKSGIPEDHVVQVECWDADSGQRLSLLDTWRKAPGDTIHWRVEVFGPHKVYVVVKDEADNVSCPSDTVHVEGGLQPVVGVGPASAVQRVLFDLSGRRVQRPARSGIYFERVIDAAGRQTRRIVVIR